MRLLFLFALSLFCASQAQATIYSITVTQGNSQCSNGVGTASYQSTNLSDVAGSVASFANGRGCPGFSVSAGNINTSTGAFSLICANPGPQCANQSFTASMTSSASCTVGTTKAGYGYSIGSSGSVCSAADGCVYSGSVPSGSPIAGYGGSLANPVALYGITFVNTGKTCSSQNMTGVGSSLIDITSIPKIACPSGQVLTVSGGVGSCNPGNALSPSSGTQLDGSAANTPTATGNNAPGSSPDNPSYFDKSGLATDAVAQANANQAHADSLNSQSRQDATTAAVNGVNAQQGLTNSKLDATNAKLDQIHQDLKTGVKMDETGTQTDSSLSQQAQNFETAAQSQTDSINSINGAKKVTALDWVWSPSIPAGQCESLDFSNSWAPSLTLDICAGVHVELLRSILAWVYSLMVSVYIWHRISGAVGEN